jgi:hypothetical protein
MTVRNLGEITIESVEWDYVFIDPITKSEVGRHRFFSSIKLGPHQSRVVVEQSSSPPTKVISVKALLQPELNRFIEEVVIRRVTYENGVVSDNRSSFPSAVTSGSLYIKPAQ